jgi:isopenicillin-N N-acyltransferase like protein
MSDMIRLASFVCLAIPLCLVAQDAQDRRFPEKTFEKGHLKYHANVPVLTVRGTPEEIGRQFGELMFKPATAPLINRVDNYFEQVGWAKAKPVMLKLAPFLFGAFPKNNQTELTQACKTAGVDEKLLTALNCIPDLETFGCSTFVVEPGRSATGKPLFGRNLDWPPYESLPEYTLLVIAKAEGKRPVAMVSLPILIGCLSGMNDAGLCLTINAIDRSKDGSTKHNLGGTPMMMLFRKILEECATVAEAEAMLKEAKRTTWFCLTACDPNGGCVFEATPKMVVRRSAVGGCTCCTNHFRTDELSLTKKCDRFPKLEAVQNGSGKVDVDGVWKAMHAVNQGQATMQTMVFEPADRVLHLAFGGGKSASARKPTRINLNDLFGTK